MKWNEMLLKKKMLIKGHYIELINEKASQLMSLRTDLEKSNNLVAEYKIKCTAHEYREIELRVLVNKMRTNPSKIEDSEAQKKLKDLYNKTVLRCH